MKFHTPSFKNMIFNLKHRFIHHLSEEEHSIILNTNLFHNFSEAELEKVLRTSRVIKYSPGKIILRPNKKIKGFYVIAEGIVNIFAYQLYNMSAVKVLLNQVEAGSYFGEKTHLGNVLKINHAYLEAGTDVTVIQLKTNAASDLGSITNTMDGHHSSIEDIINRVEKLTTIDYKSGETIFNLGDDPDKVYIILEGKIKLQIPNKISKTTADITINRGQLFGELGVLRNSKRAATAIAESDSRLLIIEADEFKRIVNENPGFKHLLFSMQEMYRLPIRDRVEICLSDNQVNGKVLSSIYSLADGRLIIASKTLNMNLFSMNTMNMRSNEEYHYSKGKSSIQIQVLNGYIIAIRAFGVWEVVPQLCEMLLARVKFDATTLAKFSATGNL